MWEFMLFQDSVAYGEVYVDGRNLDSGNAFLKKTWDPIVEMLNQRDARLIEEGYMKAIQEGGQNAKEESKEA